MKINHILLTVFILYGTIFSYFNDGGINLLVVYFIPLLLVTIVIFKKKAPNIFSKTYLPVFIFAAYYILSAVINFNTLRFSSLLYSLDLIVCFLLFYHLLRSYINRKLYIKWLAIIITIFFFTLIAQQLGIILGIDNFFNKLNSSSYEIDKNFIFYLNSLSTEPSYAATIVSICFFSLLKLKSLSSLKKYSLKDFKNDKLIWFMYLYLIIFFRSVFGIIFFSIIIYQLISLKKIRDWIFLSLLIGGFMMTTTDFNAIVRLKNIFEGVDLQNISEFYQIDHSGSIRVLPFYNYIVNFNPSDIHTYIGFGLDYSQNYLQALIPGIEKGSAFGGIIPMLIFDFGLIGFILLWRLILKLSISQLISVETLFIILVMVNSTINTQLFWFTLIIFSINKIIATKMKFKIKNNSDHILQTTSSIIK